MGYQAAQRDIDLSRQRPYVASVRLQEKLVLQISHYISARTSNAHTDLLTDDIYRLSPDERRIDKSLVRNK